MIRKVTLLMLACVGMFCMAHAQKCGFDLKHQQLMASNPVYAQNVQQMNTKIANMLQSNSNGLIVMTPGGPVYQIPVVLHVIHTGGPIGSSYNPTDAQLTNMISYLNQSYAATWPSYPNATSGGTYIPLQFVLAQRTPSCTPTNGILRVNGSSVPGYAADGIENGTVGAPEATVKALSIWPNTEYYNIWIVNKIDGQDGITGSGPFTAGYAYFPGAPASVDGTIMLASQAKAGEITLTHEIGHAFSLYHTFEGDAGGSTCPTNSNCVTNGDRVCDTDPHMRSVFNCPSGTNTCTGTPFGTVVHNFMDYSSCQDRFTPGQSTRVLSALAGSRATLISSLGGTPIAGAVTGACTPTLAGPNSSNAGPRDIVISDASFTYMSVTSSGYTGDANQVYLNKACQHMAELTSGNIYTFSIGTGNNPENVKVFVDYNNDGIFQANEEVYAHAGSVPFETHTFQYAVPNSVTIPGLVSCVPLRMRIVSDRTTAPPVTACGPITFGQAEDYSILIRGGGPSSGAVSISLTSGSNPSCFNSPLLFTAIPGAGLLNPTYQWYVNGVPSSITTPNYVGTSLNNNDVLTVKMYFVGPCGNDSSLSLGYTIQRQATVPAAVSIAITNGTNPGCSGQVLTFTATPVNGGAAPTYQWMINGTPAGANSPTFTSAVPNNGVVTVDMLSNSSCAVPANATSNAITITHAGMTADIIIGLTGGTLPACPGKPLTFTAQAVSAGANPQFQWLVNGVGVPGATGTTFTSTTLANNDVVTATLTASDPCVINMLDTSNAFIVSIAPISIPQVSVAITNGSNPGCLDSLVEFTATASNHGNLPIYEWLVNGNPVGTGLTYSSNTLLNGDLVTFRSIATDGSCYQTDTAIATPIVMSRFSVPSAPFISLIGNMLVATVGANIAWFGPNGEIPGATGTTYHPTEPGTYYAVVSNGGCYSAPSNILNISLLTIGEYNLDQVKVFPNPSTGFLTFDWGTQPVNVKLDVYSIAGQGLIHEDVNNQTRKVIDMNRLANGHYFVVIKDDSGKVGTIKITLNK